MASPTVLLATLCATTFTVSGTGSSLSPFLLDMARDLATDLSAIASLAAILTITWSGLSMVAGALSDRIGRRPVLTGGLLLLAAGMLGLAHAGTYPQAAAWQLLAGAGGGSYMGTVFATVSDRVPPEQRGRALGWVITGQSLAFVLGVPLLTIVGSFGGWRGAFTAVSIAAALAAVVVWRMVPAGGAPCGAAEGPKVPLRRVLDRRIILLLGASGMERGCYVGFAIYMATYLLTTYQLSLGELALPMALVALGNLVGNTLGSNATDRFGAGARFFAAASIGTGCLALPLLLWQPGLVVSVLLGFLYTCVEALGRPPLMTALTQVPREVRGLVLGLNVTTNGIGWVSASTLGGWLVVNQGFGGLAVYLLAVGWLGGTCALASWYTARGAAPE